MGLSRMRNLVEDGRCRLNFELVSLVSSDYACLLSLLGLLAPESSDGPFMSEKLS